MRYFAPNKRNPYQSAYEHIKAYQSYRTHIQVQNNTSLVMWGDGEIRVVLHNTPVVTYYRDQGPIVTLQARGWHTVTTQDRIRIYSGAHIFSKKGKGWHLLNDEYTPIKDRKCSCCHGLAPEFNSVMGKLAGLDCKCANLRKFYPGSTFLCRNCRDTGYIQVGGSPIGIPFYDGMQYNMLTDEVVEA